MKKILPLLISALVLFQAVHIHAQNSRPVLNHIAVYVTDLKKSTAFYMDVVRLDTIPEPFHDGRHTWFSISESSHLHLIQGAKGAQKYDKNSHLCFSVPSIDEVIARLKDHKIGYESWTGEKNEVTVRVDGIKQIYFNDPDGYWIEINNDYPNSTH